jgi:hypothetical protein
VGDVGKWQNNSKEPQMAKKVAAKYKAAPTNHSKKDAGSFRNSGQKKGKNGAISSVKESLKNSEEGVKAKLRKISKALFMKRQVVSNHSQVN